MKNRDFACALEEVAIAKRDTKAAELVKGPATDSIGGATRWNHGGASGHAVGGDRCQRCVPIRREHSDGNYDLKELERCIEDFPLYQVSGPSIHNCIHSYTSLHYASPPQLNL